MIQLQQLTAPWFHYFIGSISDFTNYCWSIADRETDLAVRMVRGSKMQTLEMFDNEVSAAFQFPYYFGENWDALKECLADLSWLPASGYVMAICDATEVLSHEVADEFSTFLRILTAVAQEWSVPVNQGEAWDRPGRPFHIVLHALPENREKLFGMIERTGIKAEQVN